MLYEAKLKSLECHVNTDPDVYREAVRNGKVTGVIHHCGFAV